MSEHLKSLNPAQREAVMHTTGPLLIIAGAGAGKTKTLTYRILHLIREGTPPRAILAITFTNKAAKEMRERVEALLAEDPPPGYTPGQGNVPFMSTFHALGVHILRAHSDKLGLVRHFAILDRSEALARIKDAMREKGLDPKEHEPRTVQNQISRHKGELRTPNDVEKMQNQGNIPLAAIWRSYEQALADAKSVDFDDLLVKPVQLFTEHPEVLTEYQDRWQYIHIDEYQDTNHAQYEIARLLAQKHHNICVVGDEDQNVYSWRGADIKNILNFEDDYPEARTVILDQNYRSTQTILSAAHSVISRNQERKEKTLFTENKEGETIPVIAAYNETEEAERIAERIAELQKNGAQPRDIAILYRANFQSRVLEEAMLSHDIPYQILGTRFFERKEVKDLIAYVKAGLNPDSTADISRIINEPRRGIGKTTLARILSGREHELTAKMKEKVDAFRDLLGRINAESQRVYPSQLLRFIIHESGLERALRDGSEEEQERLANMKELVSLATKYDVMNSAAEALEAFLDDAALATDQDSLATDDNSVKLMTVHASKGLEFPYVFIAGLEEDLFPYSTDTSDTARREEERRLFYVALTRAQEKAFLTHTAVRRIFGQQQLNAPSSFLSEIDDDFLAHEGGSDEDSLATIFLD